MRVTRICLLHVVILATLPCDPTNAEILNINGDISGTINGSQAIAGHATGTIDTTGVQGASFTIPFTQWPTCFDPAVMCYAMCPLGALMPIGNAKNIFDLTGGNFSYLCEFSYPDSPGSAVTVTGNVTSTSGEMAYTLGIVGEQMEIEVQTGKEVTNVQENWTNGPNNTINVTGSAKLLTPELTVYPVSWSMVFDPDPLPDHEISFLTFLAPTFNRETNVLEVAYMGDIRIVPEPSALTLLGLVAVSVSAYALRRRKAVA